MTQRDQYIKPSLLRLEYSTDTDVVSFGSCKSQQNTDSRGSGTPGSGLSCETSSCSSASAS